MNLDKINALTLDDVKSIIQSRVFGQKDPLPQYDEETDGEYETWYNSQFTTEELDAEFLVYKQELLDDENERLRKKNLEDRFYGLQDYRRAYHKLHPDKPNPALWIRDLKEQSDHADAESKISALEADETAWLTSEKKIDADFEAARIAEYIKEGATVNGILEALWELNIEGDSTKADALQVKRQAVKLRVPKPK